MSNNKENASINDTENVSSSDKENSSNNGVFEFFKKVILSEYTWLSGAFTLGMLTMKLISCICAKCKKPSETGGINIPDSSRTITSLDDVPTGISFKIEAYVPIGITFEEGKEIELISLKGSNTYFEYNGVISKTSWVSKNDGILFYNYNDNIKYADHKNIVMTEWSKDAKTDFDAVLEVFDTNKDKIFDDKDDKFKDFYIWQDKNSNGSVEDGELRSLKDLGIKAFNFNDSKIASNEQQEQGILNVATTEWDDGKVTGIYDLVFTTEEVV
ncbi:hypothetical protein [Candidatus Bandiella numerosa]|uniref:hypothetical protein n=1 Tax=Candidatus Bandiella numerosa TaxID=2570586 RepID=UPI001F2CE23B|nr:hypothetical protein [Candidatus Bandiella numerosa]